MMNTMTHSAHATLNTTNASLYSLVKPSQAPTLPRRYLQDWANMPSARPRGLRRDLRALLNKITPHYADICTALLWASMIPTMVIVGTLAGY